MKTVGYFLGLVSEELAREELARMEEKADLFFLKPNLVRDT